MKKTIALVVTLCMLLAATLTAWTGCTPKHVANDAEDMTAKPLDYTVAAQLDIKERKLTGTVKVDYTAPCDDLQEIWLWAPFGITAATYDGKEMATDRQGVYTRLALAEAYPRGTLLALELSFVVDYPDPTLTAIVQDFIPVVAAYDNGFLRPAPSTWTDYAMPSEGEVHMSLSMTSSLVAVTNAGQQERVYADGQQVLSCTWWRTDGCMLATGPHLMRRTATVGNTTWEYYATSMGDLTWQSLQQVVENAHALWGDCTRKHVALVYTGEACCRQGMATLAKGNVRELIGDVVAQWCTIKTDSACPWIAAGLRVFAEWCYLQAYDPDAAQNMIRRARQDVIEYGVAHGATGEGARMDKPLNAYDQAAYSALLCNKGLLMWYTLHELAGNVCADVAQALCRRTSLSAADVLDAMRNATNTDYSAFFKAWLEGKVLLA